jgi:16S rRNA processing protein RimM
MKHSRNNPLPEGQFYHDQIIGLQVETIGGEYIGYITDILTGVSNDNFIVKSASGEVLIPAIEDVIQSIDLAKGIVIIEPIEGLLELNKKKPPKKSGGSL